MSVRPLSDLDVAGLPSRGSRLKVCVVSLIGAARNGGIGTATDAMVRHIASDGHDVTLLYTLVEHGIPVNVARLGEPGRAERTWKEWVEHLASAGVGLEMLDHQGSHNSWLEKSWRVKEFVGRHQFDVVYFDEWHGSGYYSLLAKRAGLFPFADQLHVVFTHAGKQWVCASNDEFLRQVSDVTVLGMERRSVEMADVVIGPSRYLLEEYQSYGWKLPASSFHHPLPLLKAPVPADTRRIPIDEIVFFGRLEARKGLWLFCDALDRLGDRLAGKTVTFMGPLTATYGTSSGTQILQRSANWRFRVRLVTDFDTDKAQRYLAEGRRFAVVPSLADNSPCVIYECMEAGIPFLTTSSGGAKELIDERSWPDAVVEPTVAALTDRLASVLRDGAKLARPSFEPAESLATWTGWLRLVSQDTAAFHAERRPEAIAKPAGVPLLVVIDSAGCAVSALVGNIASMVQRFGGRARCLLLSDRRGHAWEAVKELLAVTSGGKVDCFSRDSFEAARRIILDADLAFFMDADTELLTPFFLLALGALAQPRPAIVTCLGAGRPTYEGGEPQIEVLPAGDIPGLSALGQVVIGPVWALSPRKFPGQIGHLSIYDERLDELTSAWTLGETLVRERGDAALTLLPIVGAITSPSDTSRPLLTADRLRMGARQIGLGTSLHAGGAPWFAIATFGARSDMPSGALTLRNHGLLAASPLRQRLNEAQAADDFAAMAAIYGRTEMALQIESGSATKASRVHDLIDLAVESVRHRPMIDLLGALAASLAIHGAIKSTSAPKSEDTQDADRNGLAISTFLDPRLTFAQGHLRSTGSTRSGGPAKLRFYDVPLSGHTRLDVRFRSLAIQPLLLRVKAIDQDSGDLIGEAAVRITRRDQAEVGITLPGIFGRFAILLEFSGAERIDLATEALAIR